MKIVLIGATGLIGSAIATRLSAARHEVTGVARHPSATDRSAVHWISLDISRADAGAWAGILAGADAVVNCAGILQDGPDGSTEGVHASGPAALFRACASAGVRRVVHLSAIGVGRETPTAFSKSKRAGEQALMALDLDWIILRPAVVIGRGAYGASALLRGLASLAFRPSMPHTAPLQIVHLDDLIDSVLFFLAPGAPSRLALDVVGPRRYGFDEVVGLLRRWMRWPAARVVRMPDALAGFIYRLGDLAGLFGWRPPVRSTARREMVRGAIGDPAPLMQVTGLTPHDVEDMLNREPASVQERWFARLYLLKPLIFVVFPLFWIATGLVSVGPGRERGVQLVMEGGTSETVALLTTLSGGLADIVIGTAIAFRRTARLGLYAAFGISIVYLILGTILVPRLWLDPLGPMLKIGPVMVFNLVALAMLDDR
jgi:uncharacterized protein YbjT (DUF2867 family)